MEKVLCNTDMIHLQDQSPDQEKVEKCIWSNDLKKWRHLSCMKKSAFFSNCAEDAHCLRDLFYQSYVCPFIPEENNQDISTRPIDCLNNGFLLTWSSQHEGGQWIVKHQTLQVGCHFKGTNILYVRGHFWVPLHWFPSFPMSAVSAKNLNQCLKALY